jgi:type I restriction enzyme R subunit
VIDECHRGGANDEGTWRAILDYFAPAVQLGPDGDAQAHGNADTYAYFGEPVYTYSLKEGINDGFLTPFKVRQIATTLGRLHYTPDDAIVEGDRAGQALRREGLQPRHRDPGARGLSREGLHGHDRPAREDHRVLRHAGPCADGARPDQPDQEDEHRSADYCVRVTANDGAIGDQHLRAFQDNEKTIPTILTTSQKLSTGVDARNVRNIVLMRPVNSMIEFKQIIGRGTRLYDGKDYFTIIDFVKAHHHFSDPDWDGEPMDAEHPTAAQRGTAVPLTSEPRPAADGSTERPAAGCA